MVSRSSLRNAVIAAVSGGALAALAVAPSVANASGHTCASGDACYYNSANYAADPTNGTGVVNPWSAVSSNYFDLDGSTDYTNPNYPSPHTYNNPDICNTNAFWAAQHICNENDTISSVKNRKSISLRLYNDAFYSGSYQTMSSLTSLSQVRNNDQISSFCWSGTGQCNF